MTGVHLRILTVFFHLWSDLVINLNDFTSRISICGLVTAMSMLPVWTVEKSDHPKEWVLKEWDLKLFLTALTFT